MRTPINRFLSAAVRGGLLTFLIAALATGCSADDHTHPENSIRVQGTWPNWDVEDMVKQSDAIVIGAISNVLGSKQEPGIDDPPSYYYEYKDFELTVEEVIHSSAELPDRIAILAEVGISTPEGAVVLGMDRIPSFQPDERVLLFLRSLEGPKFSEGVGRPVPKGFKEETYFQVVVGGKFGKLVLEDDNWKDGHSKLAFERDELKEAIDRVAAAAN